MTEQELIKFSKDTNRVFQAQKNSENPKGSGGYIVSIALFGVGIIGCAAVTLATNGAAIPFTIPLIYSFSTGILADALCIKSHEYEKSQLALTSLKKQLGINQSTISQFMEDIPFSKARKELQSLKTLIAIGRKNESPSEKDRAALLAIENGFLNRVTPVINNCVAGLDRAEEAYNRSIADTVNRQRAAAAQRNESALGSELGGAIPNPPIAIPNPTITGGQPNQRFSLTASSRVGFVSTTPTRSQE